MCQHLKNLAPVDGEEPWPHERYVLRTLRELTGISVVPGGIEPLYDAIALLPGWEESEGSRVEKLVAEAIGLDVVELGEGLTGSQRSFSSSKETDEENCALELGDAL